jgi:hypothetical protein
MDTYFSLNTDAGPKKKAEVLTHDDGWQLVPQTLPEATRLHCMVLLNSTTALGLQYKYSSRRLIVSRIIESAAFCYQTLLDHLYLDSTQNTSIN